MSDFELSAKLRLYLQLAIENHCPDIGVKCPVSVRKRYSWSQSMVIYPEAGFQFFSYSEVWRYITLANSLGLESFVSSENGLPVIEITENFKNW